MICELQLLINFYWCEGLEGESVALYNLLECPETGKSTPWDFKPHPFADRYKGSY